MQDSPQQTDIESSAITAAIFLLYRSCLRYTLKSNGIHSRIKISLKKDFSRFHKTLTTAKGKTLIFEPIQAKSGSVEQTCYTTH